MPSPSTSPLTQLLAAAGHGDAAAHERLWNAIYDELHAIARRQMANEPPGVTLQPTALIHEAYMRLFGGEPIDWACRRQFFVAAANSMRQIRVDYARKRKALKRGGGEKRADQSHWDAAIDGDPARLLAVDEALKQLERQRPRLAEVVTLRFFAGLTIDEASDALGVSPRTVDDDWRLAKAWLHRELSRE